MPRLRLKEIEIRPDCREIRVDGELDLAVVTQLREAIERTTKPWTLIDLEGCEFIDSISIALILQAHREAAEIGAALTVHSPQGQVERVLEAVGLTENGLVFPTRGQALAASERGSTGRPS
jgi:anti-anti-sigma factor